MMLVTFMKVHVRFVHNTMNISELLLLPPVLCGIQTVLVFRGNSLLPSSQLYPQKR